MVPSQWGAEGDLQRARPRGERAILGREGGGREEVDLVPPEWSSGPTPDTASRKLLM